MDGSETRPYTVLADALSCYSDFLFISLEVLLG
jgi:hypothetical protein